MCIFLHNTVYDNTYYRLVTMQGEWQCALSDDEADSDSEDGCNSTSSVQSPPFSPFTSDYSLSSDEGSNLETDQSSSSADESGKHTKIL